jgi:hypothetical protein
MGIGTSWVRVGARYLVFAVAAPVEEDAPVLPLLGVQDVVAATEFYFS